MENKTERIYIFVWIGVLPHTLSMMSPVTQEVIFKIGYSPLVSNIIELTLVTSYSSY